jgi:hypothetical protein
MVSTIEAEDGMNVVKERSMLVVDDLIGCDMILQYATFLE